MIDLPLIWAGLIAEGPTAGAAEHRPEAQRAPGTPLAAAPEDKTPGDPS